ncbi:GNAT family N-acetyltransferase, partial [Stenotrophomonas sp. 2YAF22]
MPANSLLFPGLPLHSARLVLSPIRRDDAVALFALQSDPDVMHWWNHAAWTRPAEARAQIDDDLAAQATGTQLKLALR